MRTAGSDSWRFEESVDRLPHLSLWVRDAFGLTQGVDGRVPPPLAGDIPDRSGEVEDAVRARAAIEWVSWWEAVTGLDHQDLTRLPNSNSFGRTGATRLMQFYDPRNGTHWSTSPRYVASLRPGSMRPTSSRPRSGGR